MIKNKKGTVFYFIVNNIIKIYINKNGSSLFEVVVILAYGRTDYTLTMEYETLSPKGANSVKKTDLLSGVLKDVTSKQ